MNNAIDNDTRAAAVRDADRLVAEGRPVEAIRALTEANRQARTAELERALVQLRHEAFDAVPRALPEDLPAPPTADPSGSGQIPELGPADLSVDALRHGFAHHGCVLVRGLISPERATGLAAGIDTALDAFDAAVEDDGSDRADDGWYSQFTPRPGPYRVGGRRDWVRASGALWTADSPRMLFELLELVDQTGVGALITEYLGERPALSANKCTLRRVPPTSLGAWHQDGAFLGTEVRTVNLWLALGHCGVDAPGLDLVPRRFDDIVEAGTGDSYFDWAVADDIAQREAGDRGVVRPTFGPGDALLFDHLFLHRTAVTPTMTTDRHAMETWFFAPSSYPKGQIPLVY